MDASNLDKTVDLFKRIQRKLDEIKDQSGTGYDYEASKDITKQQYKVHNLKDPEKYKDQIYELLIYTWSCKDHFKKTLIEIGKTDSEAKTIVENVIRNKIELGICMDLANNIKHCGLDKNKQNWSKLNPSLTEDVGFNIPLNSIKELVIQNSGLIEFNISNPENATFHAIIKDHNGNNLGNAIDIIEVSLKEWVKLGKLIESKTV